MLKSGYANPSMVSRGSETMASFHHSDQQHNVTARKENMGQKSQILRYTAII